MAYSRYRLEGNTHASEVDSGLQSRVGDALWMLARQWQVGEFRGEDAASPAQARYQLETTPVSGFRSFRDKAYSAIDPFVPLEVYAEQQPVGGLGDFWRSAEAGMHLLRLLSAHGLDALRKTIRDGYGLAEPAQVEPGESAWVRLLARRACDGERIYRERLAIFPALRQKLTSTQQAACDLATNAWVQWYEDRLLDTSAFNSWDSERMEYRFRVRANTSVGTVALEAREYPGGHLDWYSFDIVPERSRQAAETVTHEPRTVLPAPVQFAGMAASRWWEFEDGSVNFGDLNASAVDFAKMITAAFATGYGDDWFVVPVRVSIGSLAKIVSLEVRDSFGEIVPIASMASLDGAGRVWRYFELKGGGTDPLLFVPAVALGRVEGKALETVTLIRDETENLAWGIENAYEGVLERPIERLRQWTVAEVSQPENTALWQYRLLNRVPPHWIPFVPVRTGANAQIRLRRGRMSEWELLPEQLVGIRGQTLLPDPKAPLLIHEEEVPAGGVEITASYQFARRVAGQSYVWLGRHKRPARKVTPVIRDTDAVLMPRPQT